MSFLGEIRRRKVFQVAAAYAVVGWLLIEVGSILLPTFQAPAWFMRAFSFSVIAGFPLALILAWAFDLTPQGIQPTSEIKSAGGPVHLAGQRLGYVIQSLILLAVGFLVADQYLLGPRTPAVPSDATPAGIRRFAIPLGASEPIGDTDLSAHVALSSDGNSLAYVAQREGNSRLYLRRLDELDSRLLPGTDGAYNPFFSPDGESIGFYSDLTDHKLKVVSIHGGLPRIVSDTPMASGASWGSEDTIIFGTGEPNAGRSIFSISSTGGTREPLLTPDAERGYTWPEVLPARDALLYVVRPGNGGAGPAREGTIAVLDLETGESRTLIENALRPRYAPTGHIVFVRTSGLWAVPFDIESLTTTGPEVPLVDGVEHDGIIGGAVYAFSDDGMLVYGPGGDRKTQATAANVRDLVWVNRNGREEPTGVAPHVYRYAKVSPDGRRLAVDIIEAGNRDIWIHDLERGNLSRLTFDAESDFSPSWTPDGDHVVFSSMRNQSRGIYRRAAAGTGPVERLTPGATATVQIPESFSPDGTLLVFSQFTDLYVMTTAGEPTIRPLIQTEFNESLASISPDGRWIAYVSDETGQREIFVQPFPNVDAGGKWQISLNGGSAPLWSPDGQELFYRAGETMIVVRIEAEPNFTAGEPRILFSGSYIAGDNYRAYDVSRDGQRFLMLKELDQSLPTSRLRSLVVVENWFEDLERLAPPSQ